MEILHQIRSHLRLFDCSNTNYVSSMEQYDRFSCTLLGPNSWCLCCHSSSHPSEHIILKLFFHLGYRQIKTLAQCQYWVHYCSNTIGLVSSLAYFQIWINQFFGIFCLSFQVWLLVWCLKRNVLLVADIQISSSLDYFVWKFQKGSKWWISKGATDELGICSFVDYSCGGMHMVLYRKSLRGILILSYFPASDMIGSRLKFMYLFSI